MENNTADNQVAIINNSIELFRSAPEILKQNLERTAKAVAVGEDILRVWNDVWAIEDEDKKLKALSEIDTRSNNFLANASTALKEEKELRAAITQMMDAFKKMFTETENELDKTKAGTITQRVQANRDNCAAEMNKINERKRQEAERKAQKEKETIEIKKAVEVRLSNYFNDYILSQKQKLQNGFNGLKLDDFADVAAGIRLYKPEYRRNHFDAFNASIYSDLNAKDELQLIVDEVKMGKYEAFSETYIAAMTELRNEIVDKLPSKFEELQEQKRLADEAAAAAAAAKKAEAERMVAIAKANAEEKARLEAEAVKAREEEAKRQAELKRKQDEAEAERKRREAEEAEKIAREAAEAKAKAEQEAELKKQGEQTMIMFNKEAELSEAISEPEARAGYEITIKHPAGYVQIFQYWFENEGKKLPVEKFGKIDFDKMRSFCEKRAHKTGEKIDSQFLLYTESFKAVNRKAK
ncbi:MAG: hypothetical protein LBE82_11760 [Chitinophagaceae bacterium]|jgi:hypothetical protein|nr:hypothetical protein [Chitinophagaceae bacterium]